MPRVCVHIVTYNSAATIDLCLSALRAQRFTDTAVLVIDNASGDDTVQRVRAAGIETIQNPNNLGYAAAHNLAIEHTCSDYVLTLNPDVWLDPGYVGHMVEALDADSRLGSAAGRLLRVEQLGQPPQRVDSAGLFMRRSRRQGLIADSVPVSACPMQPAFIFGPDGAAAFYRRAMLEDVRLMGEVFDPDFFMHKEDIDLCWRAQLLGWASCYVPQAVAHHVRGFRPGQRSSVSAAMRFYAARNRYLLMLKNDLPMHLLRDLLPIALYECGILAYMLLRERDSLGAYGAAWKLRERMLMKRREIRAKRRVGWREMRRWFV